MSARHRQTRALGAIFELLLLAIVSYGLTHASRGTDLLPKLSANAPDTYTVAGITYTLDPANSTRIAKVRFALDPSPDAASTPGSLPPLPGTPMNLSAMARTHPPV